MRRINYVSNINEYKVTNGEILHVCLIKETNDAITKYQAIMYDVNDMEKFATLSIVENKDSSMLDPFSSDNFKIDQYSIYNSIDMLYDKDRSFNVIKEFDIVLPINDIQTLFDNDNESQIRQKTFYLVNYLTLINTFINDTNVVAEYGLINAVINIIDTVLGIKITSDSIVNYLIGIDDLESIFNIKYETKNDISNFKSYNERKSGSLSKDSKKRYESDLSLYNDLINNIEMNCIRPIVAMNESSLDDLLLNTFTNKYFEFQVTDSDNIQYTTLGILERLSNEKVVYVNEANRNQVTLVVYMIMNSIIPNTIRLAKCGNYIFLYMNNDDKVILVSGTEVANTTMNDVESLIQFVTKSESEVEYHKLDINTIIKHISLNEYITTDDIMSMFNNNEVKNESLLNEEMILNEASSNKSLRNAIQSKIIKYMKLVDKTDINADKYSAQYNKMSDTEFLNEMKKFVKSDKNFYMEFLPNKNYPHLEDVVEGLDYLKVPKDEYVFMPQDGNIDNPIRTRYKHPVGYVQVKRMRAKRCFENHLMMVG